MSVATERPDELIEILEGDMLARNDLINRWGNVVSSFQNIPGLVGFWPMSSVQRSTGNAYDLSGQGRTLTYNGNPTYNIYNSLVPYIDLDGIGDYLSRADETDLDILGNESQNSIPGLTCGGWFYPTSSGITTQGLITKGDAASIAGSSWNMNINSGFQAIVYNTPNAYEITPKPTVIINNWYFFILRFVPSVSVDGFVNNDKTSFTTAIPASINNTAAPFNIGIINSTSFPFTGRSSLCFLSANALPDATINALYQQSRVLFGV